MRLMPTLLAAVVLLVASADPVQAQRRAGGGKGRGKAKIGKPAAGRSTAPRSARGLGGGVPTGGLGTGISTGVTGQAFQSTRGGGRGSKGRGISRGRGKSRGGRHSRTVFGGRNQLGFFIGVGGSARRLQRSTSGLGGGIPTGGLGAGISTGVTGRAFGLSAFPHAGHCGALSRRHRGRGFIGIAHYGITHVPPDVEPGYRAVYVKSRWVPTDTGKIRFVGGWIQVADEIDSVEPVWIPASWYDTEDGSHVRVLGHWDFVER